MPTLSAMSARTTLTAWCHEAIADLVKANGGQRPEEDDVLALVLSRHQGAIEASPEMCRLLTWMGLKAARDASH